ncbi:nucleoside hydrolase [Tricharina praecox]|uniref:nucleoside hydrolase n=1 Tax=Tricharina praecox TaxID=43433 RepID=UPI00221E4D74|nr:nucleoside hydrolase [Tricharina praecox]KAI5843608.1 nucleoside hydrolase [Tricharina praecox]
MAPRKIIIDTDPGCDDILSLLLALSADPEELEILLISVCFGNVDVECCLRNVVALFHVLDLERKWRIDNGRPAGFGALGACCPVVAVGATEPLEGTVLEYDYFHGMDGLQGVHETAPHLSPKEMWSHLFTSTEHGEAIPELPPNFTPSSQPAHKEILSILRAHPADTITIVATGPLSNLALAAAEDPETFLKAKEVVVMGGTLEIEGNVTPAAEFNQYACPVSAARIYALTSPRPSSTMPKCIDLPAYPEVLSRKLNLTMLPLDITTFHLLSFDAFHAATKDCVLEGSPLAEWVGTFLGATFKHMQTLFAETRPQDVHLSLHDPMTIWYVLTREMQPDGWVIREDVDVRVETQGHWTRGMSVVDRRRWKAEEDLSLPVRKHDRGVWLHKGHGNRVRVAMDSRWKGEILGEEMMRRIFG